MELAVPMSLGAWLLAAHDHSYQEKELRLKASASELEVGKCLPIKLPQCQRGRCAASHIVGVPAPV